MLVNAYGGNQGVLSDWKPGLIKTADPGMSLFRTGIVLRFAFMSREDMLNAVQVT